jgi:Na+/pantothenate symporter
LLQKLSDYILGGRSLGSFVTALSAGASDMSGWLLMGLPGAIYFLVYLKHGLQLANIGAWLNWYWLLVVYAFILKSKIMHSRYQIISLVVLMIRKRSSYFLCRYYLGFLRNLLCFRHGSWCRLFETFIPFLYHRFMVGALQQSAMFVWWLLSN